MIAIRVRSDMSAALAALQDVDRQADYALARAMTKTGVDVKAAERELIKQSVDKPTPYSLNAVFLQPATKTRLQARVWLKDTPSGKDNHMLPLIEGGGRPLKRFEQRLRMTGYMAADERAVPGTAAQLDAYGNMSRGQITKILSQLRTAVVQGDFSNASWSKRSIAKRANVAYFCTRAADGQRSGVAGRGRAEYPQHLPRGVWERRQHAWGTSVRPVLFFVKSTRYPKALDFYGVGERVVRERFPQHLDDSVRAINAAFFVRGSR